MSIYKKASLILPKTSLHACLFSVFKLKTEVDSDKKIYFREFMYKRKERGKMKGKEKKEGK